MKSFNIELKAYEKTALSDLQGSWLVLRDTVVKHFGFPNSDQLLFHIDEAMSWESVRNLKRMEATLLVIQNIASQNSSHDEVVDAIDEVRHCLKEVFDATAEGDIS